MSTHIFAAVSDIHAGGTTAICPPEQIELDEGGLYTPNKVQKWLFKKWEDAWGVKYAGLLDAYKPKTQTLLLNGDLVEGFHHDTPQVVSTLEGLHFRIAHETLLRGPLKHGFDQIHVIRGTESHVGRGAGHEEGLARALKKQHKQPVVWDPDLPSATSYERNIIIDGVKIQAKHHGRFGQRSHTRDSYMRLYAHDIWESHVRDGLVPPDLAFRAHHHQFGDSGKIHDLPTRVIQMPCWQMPTGWVYRIASERRPSIGIVVVIIRDGVLLEPIPFLYKPDPPKDVRGPA